VDEENGNSAKFSLYNAIPYGHTVIVCVICVI